MCSISVAEIPRYWNWRYNIPPVC